METIAIVGSRGYPKIPVWNYVMYKMPAEAQVISGGCPDSPDQWAEEAVEHRIKVFGDIPEIIVYPPDNEPGTTYGQKCASRNRKIASACDRLIAFYDGCSRGTKMVIEIARNEFIPVEIIGLPEDIVIEIPLKEECRQEVMGVLCDHPWGISKEGITALLTGEGYTEKQVAHTIRTLEAEKLVEQEASENGAVYLLTGKTGAFKPAGYIKPIPTGGNLEAGRSEISNSDKEPIPSTFNQAHEEYLTTAQSRLDSERIDPRQKAALEAIDNFQRSLKKIEREARNWSWSEDLMEVTTRHYHPRKGEGGTGLIEINTYDFRGDENALGYGPMGRGIGVCSCPRRLYHQSQPCAHMIERDRKLREEREAFK